MRRMNATLLTAAMTVGLAGAAVAGDDKDKQRDNSARQTQQTDRQSSGLQRQQRQAAPDGFVLIEERLVYVLANEPQLHMAAALANLAKDDHKAAAEELRIAANYVEMQGSRGEGDASQVISQSADKLRTVADKVEQGELKDAKKLAKTFAKTNVALAEHHNAMAKTFLQGERFIAAGHDLRSAATALREAVVWNEQQPDEAMVSLVNNAERVSAELISESVGQQLGGEAQPAAAREGEDQRQNPITDTTRAEAAGTNDSTTFV